MLTCCAQDEEKQELAIICLQQIIRGRSIHEVMYNGKDKRAELIREMRSIHALRDADQQGLITEEHTTILLQQQRQSDELKVRLQPPT